MALFKVLFSKKAERDFSRLNSKEKEQIGQELKFLETHPFPFKKKIKKIKGTKESIYRLRAEMPSQSFRVFYFLQKPDQVIILRIVAKKEADRVLANLI